MVKFGSSRLPDLVRAVGTSADKKVWLVEGEATICMSYVQVERLAVAFEPGFANKRVAEFTLADVNFISTNKEKLFDPTLGNVNTAKWIDTKYKDVFGQNVAPEATKKVNEGDAIAEDLEAYVAGLQNPVQPKKEKAKKEVVETVETVEPVDLSDDPIEKPEKE
jgi:hypothetical protein